MSAKRVDAIRERVAPYSVPRSIATTECRQEVPHLRTVAIDRSHTGTWLAMSPPFGRLPAHDRARPTGVLVHPVLMTGQTPRTQRLPGGAWVVPWRSNAYGANVKEARIRSSFSCVVPSGTGSRVTMYPMRTIRRILHDELHRYVAAPWPSPSP